MAGQVSAGLLMFRWRRREIELFLVHPGGPFYKNKDKGVWSIPKGLVEEGEDIKSAAVREFSEETGIDPDKELINLGQIKQKGGKVVYAWAFEGDWDSRKGIKSNYFEMQWPPKSGRKAWFPEVDSASFFSCQRAKEKINPAQQLFIDRLEEYLRGEKASRKE